MIVCFGIFVNKGMYWIHNSRLMKDFMKPFRDREFPKRSKGCTDIIISLLHGSWQKEEKNYLPSSSSPLKISHCGIVSLIIFVS